MPLEIFEYRASSSAGRPISVDFAYDDVLDPEVIQDGDFTIPYERGYQVMSDQLLSSEEADQLGHRLMDAVADDDNRTSIPVFAIPTYETTLFRGEIMVDYGWEFRGYAWYDGD